MGHLIKPLPSPGYPGHLLSFDLSAATNRFPLPFQETVVKSLFGREVSLAWVFSGFGRNMFQAPSD